MEEVKLNVQIRDQIGSQKVKTVRREEDMIPGVVYGLDKDPTTIKFDRRTYEVELPGPGRWVFLRRSFHCPYRGY